MPGSITLPQIVLDLEEDDRRRYAALQPPKSIVVRYGYQKQIAELPYDGDAKPGCGSKLVVRTRRGTELATMLTSTCPNAGCGQAVSRKQMLEYIEASGGKDYPFSSQGRVLRVATVEDLNEQAQLDSRKPDMIRVGRALVAELNLPMKLVEVEPLLGGERIIFYYVSEQWIDFREMVRRLASEYQTRIEMHQVNAREEARLVADYERCGQYCCCKGFLKVLKPVSMKSAKIQKATLDPTKISGRCGRLMCCLRYEDETYETLRKRLPKKGTRVKCEDGEGVVLDGQILTQLILVLLDGSEQPQAYPLEHLEILPGKGVLPSQRPPREAGGERGSREGRGPRGGDVREGDARRQDRPPRRPQPGAPLGDEEVENAEGQTPMDPQVFRPADLPDSAADQAESPPALDRAAARGPIEPIDEADEGDDAGDDVTIDAAADSGGPVSEATGGEPASAGEGPRKKRRRRRRRRGRGGGAAGGPGGEGSSPAGPPSAP